MKLKIKEYYIDKSRLPRELIVNGIIYAVLILILAFSILFILPVQEKVVGEVEIHAYGLPMEIKSKQRGQLFLKVKDKSEVKAGQLVATQIWDLTESIYAALDTLVKRKLNLGSPGTIDELERMTNRLRYAELPDIQGSIAKISSSIEKYRLQILANDPQQVIKSLEEEIEQQQASLPLFTSMNVKIREKIKIISDRLDNERSLLTSGAISFDQVASRESDLVNAESELITNDINKRNTELRIVELKSQISAIRAAYLSQRAQFMTEIENARNELSKVYYDISHNKLIKSPIDGIIAKDPDIVNGNVIDEGQVILTIVPYQNVEIMEVYMYIPLKRAGEVQVGQKVYIKLDEYPPREFGMVEGQIADKSPLPESERYRLNIDLSFPLITKFGRQIEAHPSYHGQGDILTRKLSIYEKIMLEFRFKHAELNRAPG